MPDTTKIIEKELTKADQKIDDMVNQFLDRFTTEYNKAEEEVRKLDRKQFVMRCAIINMNRDRYEGKVFQFAKEHDIYVTELKDEIKKLVAQKKKEIDRNMFERSPSRMQNREYVMREFNKELEEVDKLHLKAVASCAERKEDHQFVQSGPKFAEELKKEIKDELRKELSAFVSKKLEKRSGEDASLGQSVKIILHNFLVRLRGIFYKIYNPATRLSTKVLSRESDGGALEERVLRKLSDIRTSEAASLNRKPTAPLKRDPKDFRETLETPKKWLNVKMVKPQSDNGTPGNSI